MANLISALADAIQRQEGWFTGSVSQRNNNPGNIMDVDYFVATGGASGGGKFRVKQFATYEEGRAALERLIQNYINQGHTLISFFERYAPSSRGGNKPQTYANNVAQWTGIDPSRPLRDLLNEGGNAVVVATNQNPTTPLAPPVLETNPTAESGISYLPLIALIGAGVMALIWWQEG